MVSGTKSTVVRTVSLYLKHRKSNEDEFDFNSFSDDERIIDIMLYGN